MDAVRGINSANLRQRRRWTFGPALFDEGRWALFVDGRPVPMEAKPLEILRALLLRPGETVSKDELLDTVWPNVSVVEASLAVAVAKLRRALGDDERESRIIETVPRIGYRLAVPVECEGVPTPPGAPAADAARSWRGWATAGGGLALALTAGLLLAGRQSPPVPDSYVRPLQDPEAASAIRTLDVARVEQMLRRGWNPNMPFDAEGNGALNIALGICEWNPGHDRQRLLLMARTLFEGGARLDARNVWGDTALSIARAPRYCGPDHPVTQMLRRLCYEGAGPTVPRGRCEAGPPTRPRPEA